jgi:hypothetical protein
MHKLIFFAVKYFAFRIFLIKKTELIDPGLFWVDWVVCGC